MKEATMVIGTAAFILAVCCLLSAVCCLLSAVCYLVGMARLASLLRTETRLEGVGIDGANAQMKLLGVVFLRRNLESNFASRHWMLLTLARWSGGVGLLLFLLISASIMLGCAGSSIRETSFSMPNALAICPTPSF
ncbi:hypothetical protein [Xanthomonas sp. NCPPB 2632]|uniref:hypothetical protein n=1 Tax=Xanthomonas sp. NCPPB 2632 TaxID=3240912 RepID=UPI00351403DD